MTALFLLFLAALLAATPVPMNSEIPFLALLGGGHPAWLLVAVASVGNILGSCVTYLTGVWAARFRHRRWFPLTPAAMVRAERWYNRWGIWSLLLSWAPGGDVLVALAGLWRVPFPAFLALVALAKTARYAALAGAASLLF